MERRLLFFKTEPYAHQEKEFLEHTMDEARAEFWEMGCGKSKLIIDQACALYQNEGLINAVIILAPNIVHSNWPLREFPAHCWPIVQTANITWDSKRAKTKKFKKAATEAMVERNNINQRKKLLVIAMNYEALRSDNAEAFITSILDNYKCMMVLDESSRIKNMKAQVTKKCIKLGRKAAYRRILTGTPYTTGPFDIYAQIRFLDEKHLGFKTFTSFKARYGVFHTEHIMVNVKGKNVSRTFQQLDSYRNLEELKAKIAPISSRITKAECLDLPEKVYQSYEVEMTRKQQGMYDVLRDELIILLEHDGQLEELVTPNALSLLLRLSQITGGYVPHGDQVLPCDTYNPKIALIKELVDDILASGHQVVIWARFQAEIDGLCEAIKDNVYVEIHGRVSTEDKSTAIDLFQSGDVKILIGNPASGGTGITLHKACYMIYMSNDFSLEKRLQSEARIHRIGQKNICTYIDVRAKGTTDMRVVERLLENFDLATKLTGDEVMKWIS